MPTIYDTVDKILSLVTGHWFFSAFSYNKAFHVDRSENNHSWILHQWKKVKD